MTTTVDQQEASRNGGPAARHVPIAILGAGFGGLGMAIRLKQEGVEDFIVFERDTDVGGTWWANSYPGCQCDIPSHLYSYSFAPNPEWTRTYPLQEELGRYARDCATRFGVLDHVRLGCEVSGAQWDEAANRWRIETSDGRVHRRRADRRARVSQRAVDPGAARARDLCGHRSSTRRAGTTTTTSRGRRVAVLGTGASAIQAVPRLQPIVEHLGVFQRTPPWVMPHRDRPDHRLRASHLPALPGAPARWCAPGSTGAGS